MKLSDSEYSYYHFQPPCGPVKQALLILSTNKLAEDGIEQGKKIEELNGYDIKEKQLQSILETLGTKVDSSSS